MELGWGQVVEFHCTLDPNLQRKVVRPDSRMEVKARPLEDGARKPEGGSEPAAEACSRARKM